MKKVLAIFMPIILVTALFIGCGSENKQANKEPLKNESKSTEKNDDSVTQNELNDKIKKEAVKGDFVEINDDKMNNKSVFITGEVSNIDSDEVIPTFMLKSKESDGYGLYLIKLMDKDLLKDIKDGKKVTVYGKVMGKNDSGMPEISGNVIENK
ncbi:DNA binding protein [Clostridium baratii]|uniref:OB-fold protein n=1 Tax=Clostridium baratii TaxID=1561 RepID=UPI0006C4442E|nr:hypothetical protein [Clostridium baratii]CUP05515.1 DNA binding protein [Clostridium baratii]